MIWTARSTTIRKRVSGDRCQGGADVDGVVTVEVYVRQGQQVGGAFLMGVDQALVAVYHDDDRARVIELDFDVGIQRSG